MEDEIEDLVGDVKLTDSQKSVATSNVYSMDFTDSSSDKNNSSGKDTYVIERYDSDDSDMYPVHEDRTVINLKTTPKNKDANVQYEVINNATKATSTSFKKFSIVSQEIFTQTSKTIFELAQADGVKKETLETQTSYVSITEKTFQHSFTNHDSANSIEMSNENEHTENNNEPVLTNALDRDSSKFLLSDTDKSEENNSEQSSEGRIIYILDTESKYNVLSDENNETQYENTSDFEESDDSEMEQDSLMESKVCNEIENCSDSSDVPKSIDKEIEDLYHKLTERRELHAIERGESEKRSRALTPLTEESIKTKDSLIDMASEGKHFENSMEDLDKDVLFTDFAGGRVKMLPKDKVEFKLPPIQNHSCPNSPHLNFLFSVHPSNKLGKANTLPCLYEASGGGIDQWEIETKNLASGESLLISGRGVESSIKSNGSVHLPPIHIEGYVVNRNIRTTEAEPSLMSIRSGSEVQQDAISIKDKIKELKMTTKSVRGGRESRKCSKYDRTNSRSGSPSSGESTESKLCDAAERGCEALCTELLRRLRSASWYEVQDTLAEIPQVLDKFWSVITEYRIADLIRHVSAQIESPRTRVARTACNTLASILKNTNYTKKPDFYEAVTLLLTKTGSFSRPVRRAANVALDAVVCGVELSHAVTALCIHGRDHKSPLVRCAAARLLVVSCALASGGRDLLRARPPSAAAARRHALRALAALLDDKNTDARKYAERLYLMLRPLAHFEAYYLTDVDVELATRQMKKYDRLLLGGGKDAR